MAFTQLALYDLIREQSSSNKISITNTNATATNSGSIDIKGLYNPTNGEYTLFATPEYLTEELNAANKIIERQAKQINILQEFYDKEMLRRKELAKHSIEIE